MTPIRVPRPVETVFALFLLVLVPRTVPAQLISPGKLSSEHAELEGMTNCTSCHALRTRGIARDRCLACHEPLAERIAAGSGLHSGTEYEACASCHREHLGREYALIRWEPAEFDHASVGFELEDAHETLDCRDCHTSTRVRDVKVRTSLVPYAALDRTYLGLGTACVDCHEIDDPHEGGFDPRPCSDCHDQVDWKGASASFDHDETRYPLTGRHRSVGCNDCHRSDSFRGLRFASCTNCHTDPHHGGMQAACSSCHATIGWDDVSREAVESGFDHARVFPLEAAHASADCASCHDPGPQTAGTIEITYRPETLGHAWPAPVTEAGCVACHIDLHRGELARDGAAGRCADCHTQAAWYPSTFDVARHEVETSFPLIGAHAATPCIACHEAPLGEGQFTMRADVCADCHGADQPHGDQFEGRGCDSCHGADSFRIPDFDHSATDFALEGAHESVACSSCHREEPRPGGGTLVRYRPLAAAGCSDCHGDDS
jgi:hypothetical protein